MRCLVLFPILSLVVLDAAAQTPFSKGIEIFGGYSYEPSEGPIQNPVFGRFGFDDERKYGWNGSVTGRVNNWFGLTLDISGHYSPVTTGVLCAAVYATSCPPREIERGNLARHNILLGPQFYFLQRRTLSPFARTLVGYSQYRTRLDRPLIWGQLRDDGPYTASSGTQRNLAFSVGGGLDWKGGRRIAFRVFQADYLRVRQELVPDPRINGNFDYGRLGSLRLSTGVLYSF